MHLPRVVRDLVLHQHLHELDALVLLRQAQRGPEGLQELRQSVGGDQVLGLGVKLLPMRAEVFEVLEVDEVLRREKWG